MLVLECDRDLLLGGESHKSQPSRSFEAVSMVRLRWCLSLVDGLIVCSLQEDCVFSALLLLEGCLSECFDSP